jgi:PTS system glucose-specific IIA component
MTRIQVLAPLDGVVVDLEKVPDQVFAQKMVGDGVAIDPSGSIAVAPVTGTLLKLFPGGHAFGISTSSGAELIVHIGLDTIELNGKGFKNIATEGQQVQVGTPIVSFERSIIEQQGKVILSPIVSSGSGKIVERASGTVRAGRDVLFVLEI